MLKECLVTYPKSSDKEILIEGFTHGFRLGYFGPRYPRDSPCLPSVLRNEQATLDKIKAEIDLGRMAGPFQKRPLGTLQCSPIGLVPKSKPGEFRLISHLSFPTGSSINDGISKEECSVQYASFDVAVALVQDAGLGALVSQCDIKSAFRILPVYPGDFDLLGFKFPNQFFFVMSTYGGLN